MNWHNGVASPLLRIVHAIDDLNQFPIAHINLSGNIIVFMLCFHVHYDRDHLGVVDLHCVIGVLQLSNDFVSSSKFKRDVLDPEIVFEAERIAAVNDGRVKDAALEHEEA